MIANEPNRVTGAGEFGVAVIVVNFNGGEDVLRCLRHVFQQSMRPAEVIVVDNDSSDGSADRIEDEFPEVQLIRSAHNIGFAAANNLALKSVKRSEWIALLNPDAFADRNWLQELVAAAGRYPDIRVFSSKLLDAGDTGMLDGTGDVYHVSGLSWRRDHGMPASTGREREGEVFSPCAAAAMYSKTLIQQVDGFDENYFCYHEDVDLAFRMRLLWATCRYVPASVVQHVGSGVTGRDSDFSVYHGHRNLVWTYFKNMPGWMFWAYLPQHLLMNLVVILMYTLKGKPGLILKSKWHAITGLSRVLRQRRMIQSSRNVSVSTLRSSMATGLLKPYFSRHA